MHVAKTLLLLLLALTGNNVFAQFTINGNAIQNSCNCYTLTENVNAQQGSIWRNERIDLRQSFDFTFQVFLGCNDVNGADGIAFVLQPISTSVGTSGGGMGYQNVAPAVGVTLDTYQNSAEDNDPTYDHIAIQLNGDIDHNSSATLTPITRISASNDNVEDCQNHVLRITWDATSKTLSAFFDGQLRVSAVNDFINTTFAGNPLVYWGFTGATGGLANQQKFCTSLSPNFYFLPGQARCVNDPITFSDSTVSFAEPVIRDWNFGDGSPTVNNVVNPTHTYTTAGNYTVVMTATGPDGCRAIRQQQVTVGDFPVPNFTYTAPVCNNNQITLTDSSVITYGTLSSWNWVHDNNSIGNTSSIISSLPFGEQTVGHYVISSLGCKSDTIFKPIKLIQSPGIRMYFSDTCQNASSLFTGIELSPVQGIQSWRWSFGDGQSGTANPIQHRYTNAGDYPITLYAVSADGCVSDTLEDEISIAPLAAFAGYDTLVARNQPVQLMASGGNIYQWSPSFGLDDPNARNPVATLTQDMTYYLKVFTENGCIGFDTLNIIVYDGPEIYVPNVFTPNGDGLNDLFSAFPVGMKSVQYFSVYNRLGLLIFTSNNRFQKWDGKFKGTKQPTGTYVWVADGVDYRGQRIQRKGTVLLLN